MPARRDLAVHEQRSFRPSLSQVLAPGDQVGPEGVVRCGELHPDFSDRICAGLVGAPAQGAPLLVVMERGEEMHGCEPGMWGLRCENCGRVHVFGTPRLA